jgi:hypothetical protein
MLRMGSLREARIFADAARLVQSVNADYRAEVVKWFDAHLLKAPAIP